MRRVMIAAIISLLPLPGWTQDFAFAENVDQTSLSTKAVAAQQACFGLPFQRIELGVDGQVSLQFFSNGARWSVRRYQQEGRVTSYGETLQLKVGEWLEVYDGRHVHFNIGLVKRAGVAALKINETFDARSFGKGEGVKKSHREVVLDRVGPACQAPAVLPSQSGREIQTVPLEFTISSDKPVYEVGEKINIAAIVKNAGREDVRIYSPAFPGVSEIVVMNALGKTLKPKGLKIERRGPMESIVLIPPGQSITQIFDNLLWFHCGGAWQIARDLPLPAGTYRAYVTVTNPPTYTCGSGKTFEKTDLSGALTSNVITIEVRAKDAQALEGQACSSSDQCAGINCQKYDTPVKEGHRPSCENGQCRCMCYGCE